MATINLWTDLTWDDLTLWAGTTTMTRGRSYQRQGRVSKLRISEDGRLRASVRGTRLYSTTVSIAPGKNRHLLSSSCTCPVGVNCKHAVAVIADYLAACIAEREVPVASEEDESTGSRSSSKKAAGTKKSVEWDTKIQEHLRARSQSELADLAWTLIQRFPEAYREFREKISLQQGDIKQLVAEARREIMKITRETPWRSEWDDNGYTPDYSKVKKRLERLLEIGFANEVAELGQLFLARGMKQVGESDDEGDAMSDFAAALPVVFQAIVRSSLPGSQKLLMVIDAELTDQWGILSDGCELVYEGSVKPEDWSIVADTLQTRLQALPVPEPGIGRNFSTAYDRDNLTDSLGMALDKAGRNSELSALYESEARITLSYERFVNFLLEENRLEEAARWAREGIDRTLEKYPGIASHLAASLCELARTKKQWDVVAAHSAWVFFDRPSAQLFHDLIKAATKAKCAEAVQAAAVRFLETGILPIQGASTPPDSHTTQVTPAKGRKKAAPAKVAPSAAQVPLPEVRIDPTWPLPLPEYLIPFFAGKRRNAVTARPHLDILLLMAIEAKRPAEVLVWYDKLKAEATGYSYSQADQYASQVAEAVSESHPERAIEIYEGRLKEMLVRIDLKGYPQATEYLRKLRPLYEKLNRSAEWTALFTSICEKNKNRPRFMELLENLTGGTIVERAKKKK